MVAQLTVNQLVAGSNPATRASSKDCKMELAIPIAYILVAVVVLFKILNVKEVRKEVGTFVCIFASLIWPIVLYIYWKETKR